MKTVLLEDGTAYYPAHEKLLKIKTDGYDYEIDTDYEVINDRVYVKARLSVFIPDGIRNFTGMASKPIKTDAALQWCETVAIGRACSAFGIGIDKNYCSAEEMKEVVTPQKALLDDLVKTPALSATETSHAITTQMNKKRRQQNPSHENEQTA